MNDIGNSNENISIIEEEILELIADYKVKDFFGIYSSKVEKVVLNYLYDLERKHPTFQYNYMTSPWPDMNGASAYLAWIENGTLYTMGLEYEYDN